MLKRIASICLMILLLSAAITHAQFGDSSPEAQAALSQAAADARVAAVLAQYPDYNTYVTLDEDLWYIEFYREQDGDELMLAVLLLDAESLAVDDIEYLINADSDDEEDFDDDEGEDDEEDFDDEGDDESEDDEGSVQSGGAVVELAKTDPDLGTLLADFPDHWAEVFEEDGTLVVEFFIDGDDDEEILLGAASINPEAMTIEEVFIAAILSDAEIAQQQPEIIRIAQSDPVVADLLPGDDPVPSLVEYEAEEGRWSVYYEVGLNIYQVVVGEYEDEDSGEMLIGVIDINNLSEFSEAEREQIARDNALSLAFDAEVFNTLPLPESWFSRVSPLGGGQYGVDFITESGQLIAQVIVDLPSERVLEAMVP